MARQAAGRTREGRNVSEGAGQELAGLQHGEPGLGGSAVHHRPNGRREGGKNEFGMAKLRRAKWLARYRVYPRIQANFVSRAPTLQSRLHFGHMACSHERSAQRHS